MEKNVVNTLKKGERVSSSYAEIYFEDEHCDNKVIRNVPPPPKLSKRRQTVISQFGFTDDWVSPSDLLIGIINLTPPFTSKITRGVTHEGILSIGNSVLANERARFDAELDALLKDNEAAWNHILAHERQKVNQKVQIIYKKIYEDKSKVMAKEIHDFYESSLREIEDHLRTELQQVLVSAHANIVSDMNTEIVEKLQRERNILENRLEKHYISEVQKIRNYYKILLDNEKNRSDQLIKRAIYERNDALNAFYKQFEAETMTSSMYIMSIERKKCRIKQFLLDSYQSTDIKEMLQKIKEKQEILDDYKRKEKSILDINYEWECKVKKIIELFLKFISYSLKLLPEQTTFLLDLEKMFVLQLNEIKKQPKASMSILIEDEELQNEFSFEKTEDSSPVCDKTPFVIIGDTSLDVPPRYGSRETLASNVDLPTIRLQRQYVYAKCHKYEEIKDFLESQRCKCRDEQLRQQPSESLDVTFFEPEPPKSPSEAESSNESMIVDDFQRVHFCPAKICSDVIKRETFPYLASYLDFTEDNYTTIKAILDTPKQRKVIPTIINPKDIAYRKLPFSATTEKYHHAETQYSSQEDLTEPDLPECLCAESVPVQQLDLHPVEESKSKLINKMLMKRKISLQNILRSNPKLLKMLTDESFDFQL